METMPGKQHAHQLIEQLPDSQIETAVRFLEFMLLDPVARAAATALPDNEPVTEEDRRRFHDGQAWFRKRAAPLYWMTSQVSPRAGTLTGTSTRYSRSRT
jgi:hypothetical protein